MDRDRRVQRLRANIALLVRSWGRYRDEELVRTNRKIDICSSRLGSNASADVRVVLALEGPPTVDSSSPNASALALLLVRYKQQRTSVSEQTKLMLDLLGGADSVL